MRLYTLQSYTKEYLRSFTCVQVAVDFVCPTSQREPRGENYNIYMGRHAVIRMCIRSLAGPDGFRNVRNPSGPARLVHTRAQNTLKRCACRVIRERSVDPGFPPTQFLCISKKNRNKSKRFLKRNLADVGMN